MIDSITWGLNEVAKYIIPMLLIGIPLYALTIKKVKVYETFVVGAKDGFTIAVRIIPYLVAILVAVGMFRASGALDLLLQALSPLLTFVGFPPENLPLALMRPLSGSGSLGLLTDIVNNVVQLIPPVFMIVDQFPFIFHDNGRRFSSLIAVMRIVPE